MIRKIFLISYVDILDLFYKYLDKLLSYGFPGIIIEFRSSWA
jgi:hypothetical protein